VADDVRCRGIVTYVYRDRVDWYARYGFITLEGAAESGPQRTFLDIRTIRTALKWWKTGGGSVLIRDMVRKGGEHPHY
jgi:hypothetical protein